MTTDQIHVCATGIIPKWVLQQATPGGVKLYGWLSYVLADERQPSEPELAAELGVVVKTVHSWLADLRSIGAVKVSHGGKGQPNLYQLVPRERQL